MRAIVIGGSGQIGGWLLKVLAERGHDAIGTYATSACPGLFPLDAADLQEASGFVYAHRPDVVFYPAGFTWVDGCERDPEKARSANLDQPLNIAKTLAKRGGRFVAFSTDYVFDGTSGPNTEDDAPHPLSVYGQAKLEAERACAAELGDNQVTLRTSWVFGPERQGKNFAYQLVKTLRSGKPMIVPSDQASSPSYGPDVAKAAVLLAERGASGVIHTAGPETMPRPDFARAIARAFGLDEDLIESKPTAELAQGAPRPLQGGLATEKLSRILPGVMRPLAASLPDFLQKLATEPDWAKP